MQVRVPDHFSSKFAFDFSKLPTIQTDRTSIKIALYSLFAGLGLLLLGGFELFSFIKAQTNTSNSYITVEIFAIVAIILALSIIAHGFCSIIRYKKFYFDGNNFTITYRPSLGIKHSTTEPLKNYSGIRLRVQYKQSGLIGKNKYIIDLYHKDNTKIIPLYISTKNKNIRKIWETYAKLFKLPALSVGERGLIQRDFTDISKTLRELNHTGKLPFIASGEEPAPKSINISKTNNVTTISQITAHWDILSSLIILTSLLSIFAFTIGATYLTLTGTIIPIKYWIIGAILLILLSFITAKVFSKSIIEIDDKNICIKDSLFNVLIAERKVSTESIENIELTYTPSVDRYYLTIINQAGGILFQNKLHVNDLIWIRDFLIRKIIE